MQATITRRFLLCAFVVLSTTVFPWLFYGKYLHSTALGELDAARKEYETVKVSGQAGKALDDAVKKVGEAEKKVKASDYELKLGLDLQGGASITYRVHALEGQDQAAILKDAIGVIRRRIDSFGVGEVNIVQAGLDQFTVELPGRGKEEIDRIKSVMSQLGRLEFRIVAKDLTASERMRRDREKEKYVVTPGYRWCASDDGPELLLEVPDEKAEADYAAARKALDEAVKTSKPEAEQAPLRAREAEAKKAFDEAVAKFRWKGDSLESAGVVPSMEGGRGAYEVSFSIIPGRKTSFGDFTGANIDNQMAIVLNDSVNTAPVIHSKLDGGGRIFSSYNPYTQDKAQDLVTVLKSGSLAVRPEEVSSFVVGPGLGEEAVRTSRMAMGVSFLVVLLFMAIFYHGAGWVANLAVFLNLVMTLGTLMFLGAALSLPGIAGLLLTLGMAVDANILVNERIREEKAAGKGLLQAVTAGYERAFITILDSNLTTVITAAILYWIGTGPIKGFALTLILGIGISMFTALYVTRTLFLWGMERGILTEFRMMPVLMKSDWQWMGQRRKFFGVSIALIVAGTIVFAVRPAQDKYDLEFTGGQRVIIALKAKMTLPEVRKIIGEKKLGDLGVRTIRGRGSSSENLDLATESDSFELTARIKDEAEGARFTDMVKEAFAPYLAPGPITEFRLEPRGTDGLTDFHLVLNFATKEINAEQVKQDLAAAPVMAAAKGLKVDHTPAYPGAESFVVEGKASALEGKDPKLVIAEQIGKAIHANPKHDLSEPIPQSDFIGPGVARTLRDQAMLAVLLSILAQIVYLRLRFRDFTYGVAAAIALVHDVLITLGAVAVVDWLGIAHLKINLPVIASFLTLIGYSMNDTIVVFDRIRENLGRSTHPGSGLIDGSINQTIARSIRTSMTVWLVAVVLFVFNMGAASSLEGFAFVMVIGVLTGTYSSVAIASPLLLFLPLYGASLRRLGRPVQAGLFAALGIGLLLAMATDGTSAVLGGLLTALLPAHFLWQLLRWLPERDPDALVRGLEGTQAADR